MDIEQLMIKLPLWIILIVLIIFLVSFVYQDIKTKRPFFLKIEEE
jgi:uncharacterized membrane protein YhdT